MTEQLHQIKTHLQADARHRVMYEGREHLVVPVVMIVDGVLNGALVTHEEYGRYVEAWNNRPVPVLHPEKNGQPVSANSPDVIEKNTIGVIFNARVDGNKLKADAYIDVQKAISIGHGLIVDALESGHVMEVSTGYFSDAEQVQGIFNDVEYYEIHRNIRPDHLALLPGEIGACSVLDGCGTRNNSQKGFVMKNIENALQTIAQALGLRNNCNCDGGNSMSTLKEQAEQLKANGKMTTEQVEMLLSMDAAQLSAVQALASAISSQAETDEEPEDKKEDKPEDMNANAQDIDQLVNNKVAEAIARHDVMQKLASNERCPFDADDLKTMSVKQLEKLEKSIRPVDYSGAGGFAANSNAVDSNVKPLMPRTYQAKKGA